MKRPVYKKLTLAAKLFRVCVLSQALQGPVVADTVSENHPAVAVARRYIKAVVAQDWKACADMLLPRALERKYLETIRLIKNSPTIPVETARLAVYGFQDLQQLQKLTPREFYILEHRVVQKGADPNAEATERQLATLRMEVVAAGAEENGAFFHAVIRTYRETHEMAIRELTLVSLLNDPGHNGMWYVVPDTQLPVVEPLAKRAAGK